MVNVIASGLREQRLNRFAALSLNIVSGSWHIENDERNYKVDLSSRQLQGASGWQWHITQSSQLL